METRRLKNERLPIELLLLADEAVEAINKYIHNSDVYIIERGEKIIGVYVLQKTDAISVEIKNIAVDEEFQRQGIGKFLLQDASRRAQEMGFKRIIVGTADASTPATASLAQRNLWLSCRKFSTCITNITFYFLNES